MAYGAVAGTKTQTGSSPTAWLPKARTLQSRGFESLSGYLMLVRVRATVLDPSIWSLICFLFLMCGVSERLKLSRATKQIFCCYLVTVGLLY
jgi:hypothetical protein